MSSPDSQAPHPSPFAKAASIAGGGVASAGRQASCSSSMADAAADEAFTPTQCAAPSFSTPIIKAKSVQNKKKDLSRLRGRGPLQRRIDFTWRWNP